MKLFQKKPKDERVVAEANRIYKIGYLILIFGLAVDLYAKLYFDPMREIVQPNGLMGMFLYVGLEVIVILASTITCLVLMVRRGISDDDQYAESETFAFGHYLKIALLAGLIAGLVGGGFTLYSLGTEIWIVPLFTAVSLFVCCTIGIVALQYVVFRMARTRRRREAEKLESEE